MDKGPSDAKGGERSRPRPAPEAELELDLRPNERPGSRCPRCHDVVEEQAYRCAGCRARYHLGCLAESRDHHCALCASAVLPERRVAQERFSADARQRQVETRAFWLASGLGFFSWPAWAAVLGLAASALDLRGEVGFWLGFAFSILAASATAWWARQRLRRPPRPGPSPEGSEKQG